MTDEIGNNMNIDRFIETHPFLYHLTDSRNFDLILKHKKLFSTQELVIKSDLEAEFKTSFLRSRRPRHFVLNIDNQQYFIRDQRPISEKNLAKCLTPGWGIEDFYSLLNNRVFFWPTIKRLQSHYARYKAENPVIIKVKSSEILTINLHAEYSRLNSGATRSNSYLGGAPPLRGEGTFLSAEKYNRSVSSVAEVTFQEKCILPESVYYGNNPSGPWTLMVL